VRQPVTKRVSKVLSLIYSCSSVTKSQSKAFILAQVMSVKILRICTYSRAVHGCIQLGLGLPHKQSPARQGSVESSHGLFSHQCEGVRSSLDPSTELPLEERNFNQAPCRQCLSGELHQLVGAGLGPCRLLV